MFYGHDFVFELLDDAVGLHLEGDATSGGDDIGGLLEHEAETGIADALDVDGPQQECKEGFRGAGEPEFVFELGHVVLIPEISSPAVLDRAAPDCNRRGRDFRRAAGVSRLMGFLVAQC
jgi:hypothetical protein